MATTKQVVGIGPFKELIASGVRSGNILTISGQVGIDAEGAVVGIGDIKKQLNQTYRNVMAVLSEFNAPANSIVDEVWFVTDIQDVMANIESLIKIREEVLGETAREVSHTLVEISRLVAPDLLIEVKCIACL